MERCQALHRRAKSRSQKDIFSIHDIQTKSDIPATPPDKIDGQFIDLSQQDGIDQCLHTIFMNFTNHGQQLQQHIWVSFLGALLVDAQVDESMGSKQIHRRNAKFSLAITATQFDEFVVESVVQCVIDIEFHAIYELAYDDLLRRLLVSESATNAFLSTAYPQDILDYSIPPTVMVVSHLPVEFLRGWVCMNNTIVVNITEVNRVGRSGTLSLFSVIAHQWQHGMRRNKLQNFNAHMHNPNYSQSLFMILFGWCCGEGDKRAVPITASRASSLPVLDPVKGQLARWHTPNQLEEAEELAWDFISRFDLEGHLSLNERDVDNMRRTVGIIEPVQYDGMFLSRPWYFY